MKRKKNTFESAIMALETRLGLLFWKPYNHFIDFINWIVQFLSKFKSAIRANENNLVLLEKLRKRYENFMYIIDFFRDFIEQIWPFL